MKKTILGLAVAAVAFTGCSKNETDSIAPEAYDSKYISFMPATSLSKSANNAVIADLQGQDGFEVYAFAKDGAPGSKVDKLYFTKPDGSSIKSNYVWTGATTTWDWAEKTEDKKWPADGDAKYPLTFFAAYPSATFKTAFDANYDVNFPTDPYDWAHTITVEDDLDDQVDYLAAKSEAVRNLGASVPFTFKHIMSNIQFAVKTPAGFTAYVVGVKIHNLHKEDKYNFFTEQWDKLATGTAAAPGAESYTHFTSAGTAQEIVGNGAAQPIAATTAANSLKLLPQNYATPWNLGTDATTENSFKKAAAAWLAEVALDPSAAGAWTDYEAYKNALKTGVYVELIYALVDNNDVCVVGKIKDKKVNNAGNIEPYTGDSRFLRVGYVVDLAKTGGASGWAPGKRYTYTIALGTADASNGTVLDPTYAKEDGTETSPKDDSGKEPGDPVNPVAGTYIGFDVVVSDWTNGTASFE